MSDNTMCTDNSVNVTHTWWSWSSSWQPIPSTEITLPVLHNDHLDLSRCPLLHKSLQPLLRTVRVVIQPESSGCIMTRGIAGSQVTLCGECMATPVSSVLSPFQSRVFTLVQKHVLRRNFLGPDLYSLSSWDSIFSKYTSASLTP